MGNMCSLPLAVYQSSQDKKAHPWAAVSFQNLPKASPAHLLFFPFGIPVSQLTIVPEPFFSRLTFSTHPLLISMTVCEKCLWFSLGSVWSVRSSHRPCQLMSFPTRERPSAPPFLSPFLVCKALSTTFESSEEVISSCQLLSHSINPS